MQNKSNRVALVTGASSGFGKEFAELFAKDGYDLMLTAKNSNDLITLKNMLQKKYGIRVWQKSIDLSVPGNPQRLYEWTNKQKLKISILVNNAGIGLYGKFTDHLLSDEQELINLNIVALSELCYLYLTDMLSQDYGKILNISSIAGFQAGPFYATYFASKAYVLLFSEALQAEYESKNIVITQLCPGVSSTGFFKRANMKTNSRLMQSNLMDPKIVARAGYEGLMSGKKMVIPGYRNKLVSIGYRILPRSVITRVTKKMILKAAE
jgi:short-subunit dehydrogenase